MTGPVSHCLAASFLCGLVWFAPSICNADLPPAGSIEPSGASDYGTPCAPPSEGRTQLQTLHCLNAEVDALDAQRRSYFKTPRRLAIAGGVTSAVFGLTAVALIVAYIPLNDEYEEPRVGAQRAVEALLYLSGASAVAAFVGLGWRIVAGARGTPVDPEFRATKRQRDLLKRELRLRVRPNALAVDLTVTF